MTIELLPELLVRQFSTAANRLAGAARSAADPSDIGALRSLADELVGSHARVMRLAPEAMGGVSTEHAQRMASAIRALEQLDGAGAGDAPARLSELARAAKDVSEEALRAMPNARPVRVVVGGGGPGGLATANLLRDLGADVTVAHPGATDWRTGILIEQRAWDILRQTGGEELLKIAPVDAAGTSIMAPLSLVDSELGKHAKRIGVDVRDSHRIRSATNVDGGVVVGIKDDTTGVVQDIHADWYVDATGGTSPVARQETFRRRLFDGEFDVLPKRRTFMRQTAQSIDSAPIGWTGPDDAFVVNDKLAGTLMVYRPVPKLVRGETLSAGEGVRLLESVGVDPATAIGTPSAVVARQRLAPSAAEGRVLMAGDSVGSVQPVTQAGVLLALLDARRAADMIATSRRATSSVINDAVRALDDLVRREADVATDDAVRRLGAEAGEAADATVAKIVTDYGEQTVNTHRLFLA